MINKMQTPSVLGARLMKSVLALAIIALSFTACKDDDKVEPDDNVNGSEKAIIPEKGKKYGYKITDSDGTVTTSVTSVVSEKDSTGFPVFNVENVVQVEDGQYAVEYKAFSTKGETTYQLEVPSAFAALVKELRPIAYIEELDISGYPQYQIFDNKATVNSPLTFKGDPIRLYIKMQIIVEEGDNIDAEIDAKLTYKSGKAVKEESITTPAGTFNCTKWEHTYDVVMKFAADGMPVENTTETYHVSLWTAPGVGVVKSVEESEGESSTTELQTIEK